MSQGYIFSAVSELYCIINCWQYTSISRQHGVKAARRPQMAGRDKRLLYPQTARKNGRCSNLIESDKASFGQNPTIFHVECGFWNRHDYKRGKLADRWETRQWISAGSEQRLLLVSSLHVRCQNKPSTLEKNRGSSNVFCSEYFTMAPRENLHRGSLWVPW